MGKKLYEVRVELVSYVYAEDEVEAQELGSDSFHEEVKNVDPGAVSINEVVSPRWNLAAGWTPSALVYGGEDEALTLGDVLKRLR